MLKTIFLALSIWVTVCVAQSTDDTANKTRCFRYCSSCPGSSAVFNAVKNSNSSCRKCIRDSCGPAGKDNRTEVAMCMFSAKTECSSCKLSNSSRRYHERCESCKDKCVENLRTGKKAFPTRQNKPRRPFRGFSKPNRFVTGRRRMVCRCVSSKMCPTKMEEKRTMGRASSECRRCVERACGKEAQGDRRNLTSCVMEARSECDECGTMSKVEKDRMVKCTSCVRRCRTVSGMQAAESFEPADNTTRCFRYCGSCPSAGAVINTVNNFDATCRKCIRDSCGPAGRGNRTKVAMCMFSAKTECSSCKLSNSSRRYHERCESCKDKCVENLKAGKKAFPTRQNKPRRPSRNFIRPMGIVINTRRMVCRCVSSKMCPTKMEEKRTMRRASSECRRCVERACGKEAQGDRRNLTSCIMGARSECDECGTMSKVEKDRMVKCTSCVRRCKMISGMQVLSISRKHMCPCNRFGPCPSSKSIVATINATSSNCRACVQKECGEITQDASDETATCMFDARTTCTDDCKLSAGETAQRQRCSQCMKRCESKPATSPKPSSVEMTTTSHEVVTSSSVPPPEPPRSTTEPPPASTEPPPASTEPPPASTEPPPASTEPPPASTEPPPASTEPPPASTEPPQTSTFEITE